MTARERADQYALDHALRIHRRHHAVQCAGLSVGEHSELPYARGDFTALSNFTVEASLIAKSPAEQPVIPGNFLTKVGKSIMFRAWGVLGTTGAPTFIFQNRLSSTIGTGTLSGTSIGVSPTITAGTGVSTQLWRMELTITVKAPGQGSGACTLNCAGMIWSGAGFTTPFFYALSPSTPPTGTFTATIDNSATLYYNLSVTCGTANASNTVTCKMLEMHGLN